MCPALFYAIAFRKMKDYDNKIAVLDEAISRFLVEEKEIKFKERKQKAIELKNKSR